MGLRSGKDDVDSMRDGLCILDHVLKFGESRFGEIRSKILVLTFHGSNSVKIGLAKPSTRDLVTQDHYLLDPHSPHPDVPTRGRRPLKFRNH